jgi:hypothetical protein
MKHANNINAVVGRQVEDEVVVVPQRRPHSHSFEFQVAKIASASQAWKPEQFLECGPDRSQDANRRVRISFGNVICQLVHVFLRGGADVDGAAHDAAFAAWRCLIRS